MEAGAVIAPASLNLFFQMVLQDQPQQETGDETEEVA